MNNLYYYTQYLYLEKPVSKVLMRNGGYYRIYGYEYVEGQSKTYTASTSPLVLVLGFNRAKKLVHCIKLNPIPLRVFTELYKKIQDPIYTQALLEDIIRTSGEISDGLQYRNMEKPIKIDRTGRSFYYKSIKQNVLLRNYDCYRTYKITNLKRMSEIYFNVQKLGNKIGLKNVIDNNNKDII